MKSEKAKEILNVFSYQPEGLNPFSVSVGSAVDAVEMAEQEIMEKAIEGHRLICPKLAVGKFCCNNKYYEEMKRCDGNCNYVKQFKEAME